MGRKAWSAAGAARFAREARIATSKHLRDAEIAREWQAAKLMRAHQIHQEHLGDAGAATAFLFGGMGYQPPYPRNWVDAADKVLNDEADYLAGAELYVMTPAMCDVVVAAAQSLMVDDLALLDPGDLPGRSGLVVLPHPVIVQSVGGDLGDARAFCWHTPARVTGTGRRGKIEHLDAVRISTYDDTHGPVRPDSFVHLAAEARRRKSPLPSLLLNAIRCLPFHYAPNDPTALERAADAARRVDGAYRAAKERQGMREDRVDGEYASGSSVDDHDDAFTLRFLYAFWRLCEQRITTVERAGVNHSAGVLAERAGVSPEVRVVRLRRQESHDGPAEADPVRWKHQWVVRMHKVRQWYPREQRHKIIYRGPYVKGPEDKPMLAGETVRALVR